VQSDADLKSTAYAVDFLLSFFVPLRRDEGEEKNKE
jgi:hypothetical protein